MILNIYTSDDKGNLLHARVEVGEPRIQSIWTLQRGLIEPDTRRWDDYAPDIYNAINQATELQLVVRK